ncbi:MAG: PQQ-dependent sugar dehydrogenase [Caldilineaceae bacterium]
MFSLHYWYRRNISWFTVGVSLGLLMLVLFVLSTLNATAATEQTKRELMQQALSLKFEQVGAATFTQPVKIANAGDNRLFIVEQAGKIFVLQTDGTKIATPFLDITNRVGSDSSERGLLGLAFEPNDPKTFYVNYTNKSGNTTIARYKVTGANPNVADPASEQIVLVVTQPYANHNGGDLAFGADGQLYIPLGDGGSGGDPLDRAQKLSELLGKILRIHVTGVPTYTIPADNPFANDGNPNTRAEIWAYGLRNPWRFSFDRQTHDMWIGDVGQNLYEEVDFQSANSKGGENYGWDCYEGNHVYSDTTQIVPCNGQYQTPVTDYSHNDGSAVTGGYVYRGARYPNLIGNYIFADYGSGNFWISTPNGQNSWVTTKYAHENGWPGNPSTFGQDGNGELYVADYGGGGIYHIADQSPTNTVVPTVPTLPPFTPKAWINLPLIHK